MNKIVRTEYKQQFYMGSSGTVVFKVSDDLFVQYSPFKAKNADNKFTYNYDATITVSTRAEELTVFSRFIDRYVDYVLGFDNVANPTPEDYFKSLCRKYWARVEPKRMVTDNLLFMRDDKRVGIDANSNGLSFKSVPSPKGDPSKNFQITLPFSELTTISEFFKFMVTKSFLLNAYSKERLNEH